MALTGVAKIDSSVVIPSDPDLACEYHWMIQISVMDGLKMSCQIVIILQRDKI